ncbi:hypothetical protein EDC94DRAFT_669558 [Helicostylum pulchrum]|nr:hypothetical protein EDC94DRAFT_669558 [Helicostylum pulchrum]
MSSYTNPNKRTRVSGHNIDYVRQLLFQQSISFSAPSPVANTESVNSMDDYDCGDYLDFNDESDFLENEEPFNSEHILVDSTTAPEMNDNDIDQDEIHYKVNIPKFVFTNIERYSVMFEEVCDTYNISREGSRALRHLINMMLADETLDSVTTKLLSHEACTSLVKTVIPLPMTDHMMFATMDAICIAKKMTNFSVVLHAIH